MEGLQIHKNKYLLLICTEMRRMVREGDEKINEASAGAVHISKLEALKHTDTNENMAFHSTTELVTSYRK